MNVGSIRIKSGYLLREIAGLQVVVPLGSRVIDFKGMISLKGIGAFLWTLLEKGATYEQLLQSILDRFEVKEEEAKADLDVFLSKADRFGVLEYE